jgi:hypothetical protein
VPFLRCFWGDLGKGLEGTQGLLFLKKKKQKNFTHFLSVAGTMVFQRGGAIYLGFAASGGWLVALKEQIGREKAWGG